MPSATRDLHALRRTAGYRAVARFLVLALLAQSMPVHAPRSASAGTGPAVRWVDASGGCDGHVPCYTSIQPAIAAVRSGEVVRILPG